MFMYELLSLQRPFESVIGKEVGRLTEVIKQLIKDGQRPMLNKKVRWPVINTTFDMSYIRGSVLHTFKGHMTLVTFFQEGKVV